MDRLTYVIRKRSGTAEPVLSLVLVINRPQLRINLDPYHTQIGEGDLIQWVVACLPWIGEVQVADNPGRCEPGTRPVSASRDQQLVGSNLHREMSENAKPLTPDHEEENARKAEKLTCHQDRWEVADGSP